MDIDDVIQSLMKWKNLLVHLYVEDADFIVDTFPGFSVQFEQKSYTEDQHLLKAISRKGSNEFTFTWLRHIKNVDSYYSKDKNGKRCHFLEKNPSFIQPWIEAFGSIPVSLT